MFPGFQKEPGHYILAYISKHLLHGLRHLPSFETKNLIDFLLIFCGLRRDSVEFFGCNISQQACLAMQEFVSELLKTHGNILDFQAIHCLPGQRVGEKTHGNVCSNAIGCPVVNRAHF